MALTATLGFEEGYIIFSHDGANAFNSIYRHRFLPALAEIISLVVPYASNLYAREPPKLLFALDGGGHAHRGKKLLQDLQTQESAPMKKAMVRFRGAREKGAMAFVECLGVSQEDTMEDRLWRETLGRSLGSHDAAELVGGMCHGNGCRQETTRIHAISCTKTGWSSLTHIRALH